MFKKIYILPGLLLMLTGCINDAEPVCDRVEQPTVSFSVSVDGDDTRADETWSGGYESEEGFVWDQHISTDPDSIHPVLYDVNAKGELITSNPAGEIKNVTVKYDDNSKSYNISGKLETNKTVSMLQNGKFRIVIYANMKDYDAKNPMSTKAEFTRHGAPGHGSGENKLHNIPMFGVGVANLSQVGTQEGVTTYTILNESGTAPLNIPMLRAMAKVRVNIAENLRNVVDLTEITINRHAKSGYIVPRSWNTVSSVYDIPLNQTMNAKTGNNEDCSYSIDPNTYHNNRDKLRFFIPETYNKDHDGVPDSDELSLTIKYKFIKCEQDPADKDTPHNHEDASEEITKTILFSPYTAEGKPDTSKAPYDIIRNHVYDFTIIGVGNNFELLMDLCVKKWDYRRIETEL